MIDFPTIYTVWLRDLIRYFRQRSQLYGSLVRPLLWLFILGMGLRPSFGGVAGYNYTQFIFPGIVAMALIFTAIQSAISIIWDREFGFLKEILVSPAPRPSIVLGKALAGSTLAMIQGGVMLVFAPAIRVHIHLTALLAMIPVMLLGAFALTALGIIIAARMTSFEGFGTIMNFLIMPMFFLSGAMFPITHLPLWLKTVMLINPLTYCVDALRALTLDIAVFPMTLDILFLVGFGAVAIALAVFFFNRGEY